MTVPAAQRTDCLTLSKSKIDELDDLLSSLGFDEWSERSFAWATRFRRLVKDYERSAQTLADLHIVAFAGIMLKNVAQLAHSP